MSQKQFDKWLREQGVDRRQGRYYLPCVGKATGDPADGALRVIISTRARDRHGDILEPAGVDTTAFRRNPVVLWAHRYDALPIGRAPRVQADESAVTAEVVFDSRPFAQEVLRLYREGFLAGWSVGFLPREWEVINNEDGRFGGYHVARWELVELSAVPVPANPDALTRELADGQIIAPALRKAIGRMLGDAKAGPPQGRGDEDPDAQTPAPAAPAAPGGTGADRTPEIATEALARALTPRLLRDLREWAEAAALREIRRRLGRLD